MLQTVLSLCQEALAARTAIDAASAFADRVGHHGVTYTQVRLYRRPGQPLTSERHWQAGGVLVRDAVPGWVGSTGFDYICFTQNPLLEPIRRRTTHYRISDYAPRSDRRFGPYWDAFSQARIADAVCATAYGRDDRIASVHLGVDRIAPDASIDPALSLAGSMLVERLLTFDPDEPQTPGPSLSPRERDVMRFVADGKTDWEIGAIMGLAEATARFHADNARRKLGASNRAHAVARYVALNGL